MYFKVIVKKLNLNFKIYIFFYVLIYCFFFKILYKSILEFVNFTRIYNFTIFFLRIYIIKIKQKKLFN